VLGDEKPPEQPRIGRTIKPSGLGALVAQYASPVRSAHVGIHTSAGMLFIAWLIHDAEEALTFPATSRLVAAKLGSSRISVTTAQSVIAIALVGLLVAGACAQGSRSNGESRLYRAVLAGLEAHVATHVLASVALKQYTAGLVTAPLIMLPGARISRDALRRSGRPLAARDTARGAALMFSAALASHSIARLVRPASRTSS